MDMTAGELAALVGGVVYGDACVRVTNVAGIREAGPGDLTALWALSPHDPRRGRHCAQRDHVPR
ncbi:MAG: hypothetical protein FJY92_09995 [Candidatus Hydrogenedentes bacterium]|nr:hypothetical protein [Candidatus Hydrogenedentota bacterium]